MCVKKLQFHQLVEPGTCKQRSRMDNTNSNDNENTNESNEQNEPPSATIIQTLTHIWTIIKPFFTMDHLLTISISLLISQLFHSSSTHVSSSKSSSRHGKRKNKQNYFSSIHDIITGDDTPSSLTTTTTTTMTTPITFSSSKINNENFDEIFDGEDDSDNDEMNQLAIQTLSHRLNIQRELNIASTRHNVELNSELNSVKTELEHSKSMIDQLQDDRGRLEVELHDCRDILANEQVKCRNLERRIDDLSSEVDELRNHELKRWKMDHETCVERCHELERQLHECKCELMRVNETVKVYEYVIEKSSPDLAKLLLQQMTELDRQRRAKETATEAPVEARTTTDAGGTLSSKPAETTENAIDADDETTSESSVVAARHADESDEMEEHQDDNTETSASTINDKQ